MKYQILLLTIVFVLSCYSCGDEPGDYFPTRPLDIENWTGQEMLYVSHHTPSYAPMSYSKIIQVVTWGSFPYDRDIYGPGLLDDFALKLYAATVTNVTNWHPWNQEALLLEDCEPHVYYETNITGGLSMPELFDFGNSLPFYVITNYSLTIVIKELQTNR
jgi:hypothetical protein